MWFKEEQKKYVDEEMAKVMIERPNLTHREQKILRGYYEKEFEEIWSERDYTPADEGMGPKGSNW